MCIGVEYKVMEAMKTIKIVNHGKHIACNHVPLNLHICLSGENKHRNAKLDTTVLSYMHTNVMQNILKHCKVHQTIKM